jgi:hypothetical protein
VQSAGAHDTVEGTQIMSDTPNKLPKEGLIEPEEAGFIGDDDVAGHGLPLPAPPSAIGLPLPAPPAFGSRGPSSGGEAIPSDEDDVEGHVRS